jgi:hypothetical protein
MYLIGLDSNPESSVREPYAMTTALVLNPRQCMWKLETAIGWSVNSLKANYSKTFFVFAHLPKRGF